MFKILNSYRFLINKKFFKLKVFDNPKYFVNYNLHTTSTNFEDIKLKFVLDKDKIVEVNANEGNTLLDVIVDNEIEIDGFGACGGTASCSTCHLIFKKENFDVVGEAFGDEADMLDLAVDYCETSRLGCQVNVTSKMNGFEILVPSIRTDAREN